MTQKVIDMTNVSIGETKYGSEDELIGPIADISRWGYMEEDVNGLAILRENLEITLLQISLENPQLDKKQRVKVLVSTIVGYGSDSIGREERERIYTYQSLLRRYKKYTGENFNPVKFKKEREKDREEKTKRIILSID